MVLKTVLPPVPDRFNVDESLKTVFVPDDYGNKKWGNCVIVARAVQTLRLEYSEQGKTIPITTNDCLEEYWREQGLFGRCRHPDYGLVLLDSLKCWRTRGWKAAGENYTIHAFASVNVRNKVEVKRGIYFLGGVQLGVQIPSSAMAQFENGMLWTITDVDSPIEGGHCVALTGYDDFGVTCVTWGEETKISWPWLSRYVDEAFAVIDEPNTDTSVVDVPKLEGYLSNITS
jgi:hypothetical protein